MPPKRKHRQRPDDSELEGRHVVLFYKHNQECKDTIPYAGIVESVVDGVVTVLFNGFDPTDHEARDTCNVRQFTLHSELRGIRFSQPQALVRTQVDQAWDGVDSFEDGEHLKDGLPPDQRLPEKKRAKRAKKAKAGNAGQDGNPVPLDLLGRLSTYRREGNTRRWCVPQFRCLPVHPTGEVSCLTYCTHGTRRATCSVGPCSPHLGAHC